MRGAPLERDAAARLGGDRRNDPQRLAQALQRRPLLDVHL
jgi:hypothetical protein